MRSMTRRAAILAAVAASTLGLAAPAASAQGCTGQLVREVAPASVPFGANVVSPTARSVDSFGQQVIRPEATAPHDECP